jgi:hypothetical protein
MQPPHSYAYKYAQPLVPLLAGSILPPVPLRASSIPPPSPLRASSIPPPPLPPLPTGNIPPLLLPLLASSIPPPPAARPKNGTQASPLLVALMSSSGGEGLMFLVYAMLKGITLTVHWLMHRRASAAPAQ